MAIRFGPFAFFLQEMDDTEYGVLLRRVLDSLLFSHEIITSGGGLLETDDPGGYFERNLPFFRAHMMLLQNVHNSMIDVRPRGRLFGVHKRLISIVKAYSFAVADHADYCAAWADDDVDMSRAEHHERNGRTWDGIASSLAKKLENKWQELGHPERRRLATMLGSDQFPEQLEGFANEFMGIVW